MRIRFCRPIEGKLISIYLHASPLVNLEFLRIDWRTEFRVEFPCITLLLGVTPVRHTLVEQIYT